MKMLHPASPGRWVQKMYKAEGVSRDQVQVMKTTRTICLFLARFFLSLVFIIEAFGVLSRWDQTEKDLMDALSEWQNFTSFSEATQDVFAALVPWSAILVAVGVLICLMGAAMILVGYRDRLGAFLLALLLVPVTLLFHPFWLVEGPGHELQTDLFLKNLAILGGLLFVVIQGTRSNDGSSLSPMD
jgi:putative oxidoreductase